jgi:spermidine/putrescine transport system permease protein
VSDARSLRLRRGAAGTGPPLLLTLVAWGYLLWWIVPIAIAVRASFSTTDAALPQGFTTAWYWDVLHHHLTRSIFLRTFRLAALTVLIATPIGAALAVGLDRLRGRTATAITATLLVAVATPQIAIAVALFLLFGFVVPSVGLDARAQLLAHVTLAIPFVAIVVGLRFRQLGRSYEESAMDLGASPSESLRRVVLPLSAPALFAAAVVAFTLSFDNLVLSNGVCLRIESCGTVPMLMYESVLRAPPEPDIYALATMALVVTSIGFALVLGAVRLMRVRR